MTRPWFRPTEDARAAKPVPLVGTGFRVTAPRAEGSAAREPITGGVGRPRTPPDRTPWGALVAVTVGVVAPIAVVLWVMLRLSAPWPLWVLFAGVILAPPARSGVRGLAARRRAKERQRTRSESDPGT